MTAARLRRFQVTLMSWSAQRVVVQARDAEHAEELAEELWQEDDSQFSHKDGGIDGFDVEELDAEVGA